MGSIKDIYRDICLSALFKRVLEKPLFTYLGDIVRAEGEYEKLLSYSSFVNEIYENGGSLSRLVAKYVFEDENAYIRARAKGITPDGYLEESMRREMRAFSALAAYTSADFARESGLDNIPGYKTEDIDFITEYENRIKNIEKHGYGIFSSFGMFRLSDKLEVEPIISRDKVSVDSFVGYEEQRQRVIDNTRAFIDGLPAANVLLTGDAGTGKSSTVKAVANMFFDEGIRLIELRKDQLHALPGVMARVSGNPLKFIIFIDDLSFNKNDDNFSMLKAALEGSASALSDNAIIYATSNRRHIIKESFSERESDDVHRNDTVAETLSLSERFGLTILFGKPDKKLYLQIIHELAQRNGIKVPKEQLEIEAEAFALRRGNRSARCAEQYIKSLVAKEAQAREV